MTDILLLGGTVITMDPGRRVLRDGAVLIRGNRIVDVGSAAELGARSAQAEVIDTRGCIILPGLIDAHGHAGHCLTKGLGEHQGSARWGPLMEHIYFQSTTPDFWLAESRLAALERIKFGVTTGASMVGSSPRCDDPIYAGMVAEGYADVGGRIVVAIGTPNGPWPKTYTDRTGTTPVQRTVSFEDGVATTREAMRRWHDTAGGRVKVYPGPSSIMPSFGTSVGLPPGEPREAGQLDHAQANAFLALADEFGTGIHAHGYGGMFSGAWRGGVKCLGPRYSVAHCTGITPDEVKIIADTGTNVIHGPLTRAYTRERCPVVELLDAGANVVFATDGTAPDRSFDVLEKVRFGMWLQRHTFNDTGLIPPGKALEMVTVNAARALCLDDLGSIEPGRLADITIIDARAPHLAPAALEPQRVAYMASGQDVSTVIVDGQVVMRDRKVLTVDEGAILDHANAAFWQMIETAGLRELLEIPEGFWSSVRYP